MGQSRKCLLVRGQECVIVVAQRCDSRYCQWMQIARRHDELENFKTQIDFRDYLASRGFTHDAKQSSLRYDVMRHTNGDKLILTRKPNRHWVYSNAHDARDRGTLIDFVQLRDRVSLGEVRKELRPWLGRIGEFSRTAKHNSNAPVSAAADLRRVARDWEKAEKVQGSHHYLQHQRGIPSHTLSNPIFAGRIKSGYRGNAMFAHYNSDGLCGFEIKNQAFTGFSTGGTKGLFCSRPQADDNELIVCETAIDLLSYAALYGTLGKRFVSTAGQISPAQRRLLQSAAEKLPSGGQFILATDNDQAGRTLAENITLALTEVGIAGQRIVTRHPKQEGNDYNDVLRQTQAAGPAASRQPLTL